MSTIDFARRTPDLPSLTGLRWVAACAVFGFHISIAGWFTGPGQVMITGLFGAGATGVSLFFLLSGFVLAWSAGTSVRPFPFWRRRLARVYPLHLVAVLLAVLVGSTLVPAIQTRDPQALIANLFLVSSWKADWWQAGNPVSWSLVCEAFFYLAFPLVIACVRRIPRVPLLATAVITTAVVVVMPALAGTLPTGMVWSSSPLTRMPEFVLGVVLAVAMRRGEWRGCRLTPALAATVIGYELALAASGTPFSLTSYTIVGFALLVSALARADIERRPTGLTGPVIQHLGALSFSFYLVHVLTLQVLGSAWPGHTPQLTLVPAIGLTLAALTLALIVAQLLHTLVEVPGRRLILGVRGEASGKKTSTRSPSGEPAASVRQAP